MKTISVVSTLCFLVLVACGDRQSVQSPLGLGPVGPPAYGATEKDGPPAKVAPEVWRKVSRRRFAKVIIRLNMNVDLDSLNRSERAAAIRGASERAIAGIPIRGIQVVHRYDIVPIMAAWANRGGLEALAGSSEVKEVVLDRLDRPSLDRSTKRINAHLVWPASIGNGRYVAILDTGTDAQNAFVAPRVFREACFRGDSRCPGPDPDAEEIGPGAARNMARGHGMHVAGIAAGGNGSWKGVKLSGVAPGAGIIAINVFTPSGAWVTDQVKGLEYVAKLKEVDKVNVVAANLSLSDDLSHQTACDGTEFERKMIIDRLFALGVATVVAAGNKAASNSVGAPGCISSAVTVSSVTAGDGINTANSRSALTDLMAPGEAILSSLPVGYGKQSGTSMAAPHVSGAIALLSAAVPEATLPQILAALKHTGHPLTEQSTQRTYRRINVQAALAHLKSK